MIYTLYKSPEHARSSQVSVVVSWQRIYTSLTVTAAHCEVFFVQPNSFLAISSQLFCQLPTPQTQFSAATANSGTQLIVSSVSQSQRQSYFKNGGLLPISSPWRQVHWDPRSVFFQLNASCYSPYVSSSLTRAWVCRLQLLLAWPAQSFSGSSPVGLMATYYSLRFETPSTWWVRSPYLYPPGTGWPSYRPRHWVLFSLPPTTRMATVDMRILVT
jgi:hypothetical protein